MSQSRFTGEAEFQFLYEDHLIKSEVCFYVPNHRKRIQFARMKQKTESDLDFADDFYALIDKDLISVDVKVYNKPTDLEEPTGPEGKKLEKALADFKKKVNELSTDHLELIDHVTDKDALGCYAFSSALYPILIEKFAVGIRPGKKLKRS